MCQEYQNKNGTGAMTTVKNEIFLGYNVKIFIQWWGGGGEGVRIDFWWGGNENLVGKVYWGGGGFFQLGGG